MSAYTRDVLRALDRRGVPVVFVTGRPLRWMEDLWEHVGALGRAIVSNGAVLFDVRRREVLDLRGLHAEPGLIIAERIRGAVPDAVFAIECVDGIRMEESFLDRERVPPGSPQGPLERLWDVEAVKLLARRGGRDHGEFHDAVEAAVGDLATPTWSMPGLAEISAPGVTKAATLERVCAELGIVAEAVVAFGDMPNDSAMLAWAGTSYAMAGAQPLVSEVADHVAGDHDDDGVARALAEVFDLGHVRDDR